MSNFKDLVKKNFVALASKYYEKVNGSAEAPNYLHDSMLTEEYSVDMNYASVTGDYSRVTADIVSFDSPLPLKKRSSIKKSTGEIPKMGMKYILNEKQMNQLRLLKAMPGRVAELARKVFADVENGIFGIKELIEYAFLVGLSSGQTIVPDETNTGTGVRIDYGISDANQFGAETKWSDPAAKPVDDIVRIVQAASDAGVSPSHIWMDVATMMALQNNAQIKQYYAQSLNFVGANVGTPTRDQVVALFAAGWNLTLTVIDRSFTFEKNSIRTVKKGWTPNMVVFTVGTNVGQLVYSTLAEEEWPVEGTTYAKPNPYILVSKSGQTDPVSEKTAVQALAFPVLQDVDSIFYLDTEEASDDVQTEDDANFDYTTADSTDEDGVVTPGVAGVYTKQSVVDAINTANAELKALITNADSTLLKKINKLSDEEIEVFEENIVSV